MHKNARPSVTVLPAPSKRQKGKDNYTTAIVTQEKEQQNVKMDALFLQLQRNYSANRRVRGTG